MRMRKSAKNDNNIRESNRQDLTLLYRYVPREKEKKLEIPQGKKITHYQVPANIGKDLFTICI
jgi:hypothetical protein